MSEECHLLFLRHDALWVRNDRWTEQLKVANESWMKEQLDEIAGEWVNLTKQQKKKFDKDLEARKKVQHNLCFGLSDGKPEKHFKKLID